MLVQNRYGYGHQELIYQRALKEAFTKEGLVFIAQPKLEVRSWDTNEILGWYIPDFIIGDKIILEIKATSMNVKRFQEQLKSYLRTSKYEVGYLMNFGIQPLYYERFLHTADRKQRPIHPSSSVSIRPD
mgnify:CR=1 FL=1